MADRGKPDARFAEAEAHLGAGNPAAAAVLMSAILGTAGASRAECRVALLLRSRAREAMRETKQAIEDVRSALAIDARDARAQNTLGILLVDSGDMQGALEAFRYAVAVDPKHARAWSNLGNALRSTGRFAEAVAATRRAVEAKPDYALGWNNLGAVLLDVGDEAGARDAYARSLSLKPDPATMQSLAHLERQRGNLDAAIEGYARAARAAPDDANVLLQLGGVLAERGDVDAARDAYRAGQARRPQSLRLAFGEALTLPMVYADAAEPAAARAAYGEGIARLEADSPARVRGRSAADVIDDLRWTNFLLAYQGEDDRDLQARFAAIAGRAIDAVGPEWRVPPRTSATGRRVRVGVASAFFSEGTAGLYFRSWITGLDRSRFEIFVYHLRRDLTPYVSELATRVDRVRMFPGAAMMPSVIAAAIRADALDVLVYPELGMDVTSFALAALRLAPVQCAGWGHPVTTGHRTIDAFFTCAGMEPADADAHYTERLVRLPGIGTDYARPAVPDDASRARFGLGDGIPLFLCPQSLFKIHPDNDPLFARVLAAVPAAQLVFFEGRHPKLTAKFRSRIAAAFAREGIGIDGRVVFLGQCGHDDFLRVNAVCDAMLDTLRWSGGNTSLDALAAGLPIVTLPGRFMRGRQSAAMLVLAGVDELIAADANDYVGIAERIAVDSSWRASLRARIREGAGGVFDDRAPVEAFAAALETLARGD
jgi:protein O-GlcNAc transferase